MVSFSNDPMTQKAKKRNALGRIMTTELLVDVNIVASIIQLFFAIETRQENQRCPK